MTRITSGSKGLNDGEFSQFFAGGDSGEADAGWIVSVGFGDTFDEAEDTQPFEITRELSA